MQHENEEVLDIAVDNLIENHKSEFGGNWLFLLDTYDNPLSPSPKAITKLLSNIPKEAKNVINPFYSVFDLSTSFKWIIDFEDSFGEHIDDETLDQYIQFLLKKYILDFVRYRLKIGTIRKFAGADVEKVNKFIKRLHQHTIKPLLLKFNREMTYESLRDGFWLALKDKETSYRIPTVLSREELQRQHRWGIVRTIEIEEEEEEELIDEDAIETMLKQAAFRLSFRSIGIEFSPVYREKMNEQRKAYPGIVDALETGYKVDLSTYNTLVIYVREKYNFDIVDRIQTYYYWDTFRVKHLNLDFVIKEELFEKIFATTPNPYRKTKVIMDSFTVSTINDLPKNKKIAVFDLDSTVVYPLTTTKLKGIGKILWCARKNNIGIVFLTNSSEWDVRDLKKSGLNCDILIKRNNIFEDKVDTKKEAIQYLSEKYNIVVHADNGEKYLEYAKRIGVNTIWVEDLEFWTRNYKYFERQLHC